MDYRPFLLSENLIDLDTDSKDEALDYLTRELCRKAGLKRFKPIIQDLVGREETSSSFIGQGVAMPKAYAPIKEKFAIIIGRSTDGISYDAARNAKVHLVVMVLVQKGLDEDEELELLSELSTVFKTKTVQEQMKNEEVENVGELFQHAVDATAQEPEKTVDQQVDKKSKNEPVIASAVALARDIDARAIVIFADTKHDNTFLKYVKSRRKVIIVTSNKSRFNDDFPEKYELIQAPLVKTAGIGQVKIGVLLALSRNLLNREDCIVCVAGGYERDQFDTTLVLDIDKEFNSFFTKTRTLVPEDVQPEVLERVLGMASEIGMEGREGKAIGTIFVLGDTNRVNANISQLIINPFRGYSETESNILAPGLEETIKEFASIDGAFIITGEGVVLSAGSYLRPSIPQDTVIDLPSGLGARHAAAAGMTLCTNALAITISESTGQVTVFKNGQIALTLSRQADK